MHGRWRVCAGLFAVFFLALGAASKAQARDLATDLRALDAMRNGPETHVDELEQRGANLLKEHPASADQGQIYFHLATFSPKAG